jgi:hypothetical protein
MQEILVFCLIMPVGLWIITDVLEEAFLRLLDPGDGGTTIIRNIGKYLSVDVTISQAIPPILHDTNVWPCS